MLTQEQLQNAIMALQTAAQVLQEGLEQPKPKRKRGRPRKTKQSTKEKENASTSSQQNNGKDDWNRFFSMPEASMHKEDTEIDKKLWKDRIPSERNRPLALVKVRCVGCNREFEVSPELIPPTDGNESSKFRCNRCILNRK